MHGIFFFIIPVRLSADFAFPDCLHLSPFASRARCGCRMPPFEWRHRPPMATDMVACTLALSSVYRITVRVTVCTRADLSARYNTNAVAFLCSVEEALLCQPLLNKTCHLSPSILVRASIVYVCVFISHGRLSSPATGPRARVQVAADLNQPHESHPRERYGRVFFACCIRWTNPYSKTPLDAPYSTCRSCMAGPPPSIPLASMILQSTRYPQTSRSKLYLLNQIVPQLPHL